MSYNEETVSTTDQIFAHLSDKKIVWKEKTIQLFWMNLCIFLNEGDLKNEPPYSIWGKKESFQKNHWQNLPALVRPVMKCFIFGLQMTNFSYRRFSFVFVFIISVKIPIFWKRKKVHICAEKFENKAVVSWKFGHCSAHTSLKIWWTLIIWWQRKIFIYFMKCYWIKNLLSIVIQTKKYLVVVHTHEINIFFNLEF